MKDLICRRCGDIFINKSAFLEHLQSDKLCRVLLENITIKEVYETYFDDYKTMFLEPLIQKQTIRAKKMREAKKEKKLVSQKTKKTIVHQPKKKFKCTYCNKLYAHRSSLSKHKNNSCKVFKEKKKREKEDYQAMKERIKKEVLRELYKSEYYSESTSKKSNTKKNTKSTQPDRNRYYSNNIDPQRPWKNYKFKYFPMNDKSADNDIKKDSASEDQSSKLYKIINRKFLTCQPILALKYKENITIPTNMPIKLFTNSKQGLYEKLHDISGQTKNPLADLPKSSKFNRCSDINIIKSNIELIQ